jgi:hypothetical protein
MHTEALNLLKVKKWLKKREDLLASKCVTSKQLESLQKEITYDVLK